MINMVTGTGACPRCRQLLAGRPWQDPSVVLTPARLELIDAELAAEYKRFRRTVEWSG